MTREVSTTSLPTDVPIQIQDPTKIQQPVLDPSNVWTLKQTMQHLGLSRSTVFTRIAAGHLKPIKIRTGQKNGQKGVGGRITLFFNPIEVEQLSEKLKEDRHYKQTPGPPPALNRLKSVDMQDNQSTQPSSPKPMKKDYTGYTSEQIGALSATATQLFDEGKNIRNIVVELKVSYEIAIHLYEQWKACGPEWHLSSRHYALLRNRFGWDEERPTAEGFIKAVQTYIDAEVKRRTADTYSGHPSPPAQPAPGQSPTAGAPTDAPHTL